MTLKAEINQGLLSGLKTSSLTKWGAAADVPVTSIATLYAHSNPAQALIDLMGYATLPDYLWLGDTGGDSSWVDVVSSEELTPDGANYPVQSTDSRFGGAASLEFDDANANHWQQVDDGGLDMGTGDYQVLEILAHNGSPSSSYFFAKYGSNLGYRHYMLANDYQYFYEYGDVGAKVVSVNATHGTTNAQTNLFTKSGTQSTIITREGSGTSAVNPGNIDSAEKFKLGFSVSNGALCDVAVYAVWKGTGSLVAADRLALAQALGLE